MAFTTQVTLCTVCSNPATNEYLSGLVSSKDTGEQTLVKLDTEPAGGTKVYYGEIWAACFNHLPLGDVIQFLNNCPWGETVATAIMNCENYDDPIIWTNTLCEVKGIQK